MNKLAAALARRRSRQLYRERKVIGSAQGRLLVCEGKQVLSFCSNDYLGLANDARVISALQQGAADFGVGSGASHLISGHSMVHQRLEQELAAFTGMARALLFSTGYMANLGVFAALAGRHDLIVQDKLNHASLIDAGTLCGARVKRYTHADLNRLEQQLAQSTDCRGQRFIASDGVFSMDGDIAELPRLLELAQQYSAYLVIDEAHALGVLGSTGRGLLEYFKLNPPPNLIIVGTLGKAFGTSGAFVAASEEIIETLIQQARTYIYTTALPPAIAQASLTSLHIASEEGWRREHLQALIQRFRHGAQQLGLTLLPSTTPIQPLMIGDAAQALQLSQQLLRRDILISAIRPPTVAPNSARLRITFSAAHTLADVDLLLAALQSVHEFA